jgi:hypothetical protein
MTSVADHSASWRWRKALLTVLAAFCVSAMLQAQERLLLLHENGTLAEIETSDIGLGATRVLAQFPAGTGALPLAGGRYVMLPAYDFLRRHRPSHDDGYIRYSDIGSVWPVDIARRGAPGA